MVCLDSISCVWVLAIQTERESTCKLLTYSTGVCDTVSNLQFYRRNVLFVFNAGKGMTTRRPKPRNSTDRSIVLVLRFAIIFGSELAIMNCYCVFEMVLRMKYHRDPLNGVYFLDREARSHRLFAIASHEEKVSEWSHEVTTPNDWRFYWNYSIIKHFSTPKDHHPFAVDREWDSCGLLSLVWRQRKTW